MARETRHVHIDVIGDKHGDPISDRFTHNKTQFMQTFLRLQETLKVPILPSKISEIPMM